MNKDDNACQNGQADDPNWVEATLDELFADMGPFAAGGSADKETSPEPEAILDPEAEAEAMFAEMQFASLLESLRHKLTSDAEDDEFSEAVMLASVHADGKTGIAPSGSRPDDFLDLDLEPGENNGLWTSLKHELGSPAALAAAVFARLREVDALDGPDQAYDLEANALFEGLTLAGSGNPAVDEDFMMRKLTPLLGS